MKTTKNSRILNIDYPDSINLDNLKKRKDFKMKILSIDTSSKICGVSIFR